MLPMRSIDVNVRIDFPALAAYVAYLNANTQQRIDALTITVESLTEQLKQSQTGLQTSIEKEKE